MTAQIAVLNKNAVALASDSARTFTNKNGDDEVRNSKKLFNLSKHHPVGIMIYERAAFMGLYWEKLIKSYRKKLGKKKFDKLEDYARDFRKFLEDFESYPDIEKNSAQEAFLESTVTDILSKLHKEIDECISSSKVSDNILAGVDKIITKHYQNWKNAKASQVNSKKLKKTYEQLFNEKIEELFVDELDAVRKDAPEYERPWMDKLKSIAANSISNFLDEDDLVSGVVIAGFGEKEIFPTVITYELKGIIDGKLIAIERSHIKISKSYTVAIKPFAQSEEVYAFIFGHNKLVDIVQDSMKDIFEKVDPDQLIYLLEKVKNYGDEQTGQIQNRIRLFDKNELAEVAEAFIKLTILRKKITPVLEDVGGPVDVAVISKGDGFVWVKRKRYVDPSLNPQFSEILTK